MNSRNANRNVWSNGWNKEKKRYQNKCNRCKKKIWITYVENKWKALNNNGSVHLCEDK